MYTSGKKNPNQKGPGRGEGKEPAPLEIEEKTSAGILRRDHTKDGEEHIVGQEEKATKHILNQ